MRKQIKTQLFIIISSFLAFSQNAWSCPLIGGYPDYNCDSEINFAVLGDSLAFGFGDLQNGNKGGYVTRAARKLPNISIDNFGVNGQTTPQLIALLNNTFQDESSALYKSLVKADVIFLDLGRNDRWFFELPSSTFKRLRDISVSIKSRIEKRTGTAPLVVTAVLMLPNRGSQGPWVKELNSFILKSNSKTAPADLRFDLVSKRLLGSDQVHPTSLGYIALGKTFFSYIKKILPRKIRQLRLDSDQDGVFDHFESKRYGTDPLNPDTDGDGKSDAEEIFFLNSNPLGEDEPLAP
jgi:lysophospholipase L1-like esterase